MARQKLAFFGRLQHAQHAQHGQCGQQPLQEQQLGPSHASAIGQRHLPMSTRCFGQQHCSRSLCCGRANQVRCQATPIALSGSSWPGLLLRVLSLSWGAMLTAPSTRRAYVAPSLAASLALTRTKSVVFFCHLQPFNGMHAGVQSAKLSTVLDLQDSMLQQLQQYKQLVPQLQVHQQQHPYLRAVRRLPQNPKLVVSRGLLQLGWWFTEHGQGVVVTFMTAVNPPGLHCKCPPQQ